MVAQAQLSAGDAPGLGRLRPGAGGSYDADDVLRVNHRMPRAERLTAERQVA